MKTKQKIAKTLLKNGSILTGEDIEYLHSFIFGIYVKTGSDYESFKLNGISHMVEHLLFKGTKSRNAKEIAVEIESLGGIMNAYTARDHTCFYVKSLPEQFGRIFKIVQEMIYSPSIPADELEKEKNVIIEEIKSANDDPEDLAFQNLNSIVFNNTAMQKSILGTEESVKSISRKDLLKYINDYYINQNMFYTYAGPVEFEYVKRVLSDGLQRTGNSIRHGNIDMTENYGAFQYDYKKSLQQFHVAMGVKSGNAVAEDRHVLMLLISLLGTGMSSRLFRILREDYGLVYSIYSFIESFKESGMTGIYFACDGKNINKTLKVIEKELKNIIKNGVFEDELLKVKNQILTNLTMNYDSLSGRMGFLARSVLYDDKIVTIDELIRAFDAVTPENIRKTAKDYFDFSKFNISIVGNSKGFKI